MTAGLAHDDRKFALKIEMFRCFGAEDRLQVAHLRRGEPQKDERVVLDFLADLANVFQEVEADAENLVRIRDDWPPQDLGGCDGGCDAWCFFRGVRRLGRSVLAEPAPQIAITATAKVGNAITLDDTIAVTVVNPVACKSDAAPQFCTVKIAVGRESMRWRESWRDCICHRQLSDHKKRIGAEGGI